MAVLDSEEVAKKTATGNGKKSANEFFFHKSLILTAALITVLLFLGLGHWRSSAADALCIRDGHGAGRNGVQLVRALVHTWNNDLP